MYACTLVTRERSIYPGIPYQISRGRKFVAVGKGEDAKMLFFNEESPPQTKKKRVQALSVTVNSSNKKELSIDDSNDHRFCVLVLGDNIDIHHNEGEEHETVCSGPGAKMIILKEGKDIAMTVDGQKILLTEEKLLELLPD